MAEQFDVAILGGGMGGYVAAIRAAQLGLKTAIIESDKLGGTCLHRGCIPTKALLESAEVLHLARRGAEFGVNVSDPSFDYPVMQTRKQKIVDQLHQGVEGLLRQNKVALFRGKGRLTGPTQLQVAGPEAATIAVTNTVLATGSVPKSLPGIELDGEFVLSSDHILTMTAPPASLIIVGAGAVGVEFASLFNDLGTQVTLVEALPSLVPLEDRDIGVELQRRFTSRGIAVHTDARLLLDNVRRTEGGVSLDMEVKDGRQTLTADKLLIAVGRAGIIDDIGLDKTRVLVDRGYIKVDDHMRVAGEVFIAGDGEPARHAEVNHQETARFESDHHPFAPEIGRAHV